MARKSGGGGGGGANWMDTYGDLVTLLLCFFVLLYSMSTMDETKWQYIAQAFSAGKGEIINVVVDEPNPENDPSAIYVKEEQEQNSQEIDFDEFYMYLNEAVETAGLQDQVSVEMADTGVYMKFRDNVFFGGDSYVLLDEGKYILEIICDGIRAVDKHVFAIKVNGHTAKSASSSANEWELSSGRASSVINYMLSLDCCDPEKFSAAGYGKYRPISENDTEEGKRQNRRVEIVFIRNDIDMEDPEVMKELMELEFGKSFVSYSDADGNVNEDSSEQSDSQTASAPPTQNNGSYSSKNDRLNEMKNNPPEVTVSEAEE
ncbi:MAG: flagellar motor protein MotB [Oscillospiraceae bacterium]|nr:flagellar motor protein MotB [Oscillospiraceae bacterium]